MSTQTAEATGLPQVAMARMNHDREPAAATSHFLSYKGLMRFYDMGFEPHQGVVGISVVHLGGLQISGLRTACELEPYSQALMLGRRTAFARMQQEAALIDADGVIMHKADRRAFHGEHEYLAMGTAVRFRARPGMLKTRTGLPFIYWGSVLNLYQMMRRGFAPVTYDFGACVYHVPHQTIRQSLGNSFQNTEVPVFTDAWYTARELAISRVQMALEHHGSEMICMDMPAFEEGAFGEHSAEVYLFGQGWRRAPEVVELVGEIDLVSSALLDQELAVWSKYP